MAYGSAEAKALEAVLSAEYCNSAPQIVSKKTVQELYDSYTAAKKSEIRASSYDKLERVLSKYILPTFKETRLDRLNLQELQDWKTKISESNLSIVTKQNIYKEFRAMLNFGVKFDMLPNNPITKVGNFRNAYEVMPADKLHYYAAEQFLQYKSMARELAENRGTFNVWALFVFFCIAYYTGMRKGEINALKWSDIEGAVIHVRRSVAQKLKGGDVETPPKNKSSYRDLQAPEPLLVILAEHKKGSSQTAVFRMITEFAAVLVACVIQQ